MPYPRHSWPLLLLALMLLSASPTAVAAETSTTATATAPAEGIAPAIISPPTTDGGIQERLATVEEQMQLLRQRWGVTTRPATAPASAPAEGSLPALAQSLHDSLRAYAAELRKWQAARERIRELKTGTSNALGSELSDLADRLNALQDRAAQAALQPTQAEIDELATEAQKQEAALGEINERIKAREQQLGVFNAYLANIESQGKTSLDALQSFVRNGGVAMQNAQGEAEREALLLRKRSLEWAHALQLLRAAAAPDYRTLMELEAQLDAQRVAALGPYVRALQDYRRRMEQARTDSDGAVAAAQAARTDLPDYLQAYWKTVHAASEVLRYLQTVEKESRPFMDRDAFDALMARIARGESNWKEFMQSVGRRKGETILLAFRYISELLREDQATLRRLQEDLDKVRDRQREIIDRRDNLLWEMRRHRRRFDELTAGLRGSDAVPARELQTNLTTDIRPRVERASAAAVKEFADAEERLREAAAALGAYVDRVAEYRSELYWKHLFVRSQGPLRHDWATLREEVERIRSSDSRDVENLTQLRSETRSELRSIRPEEWFALVSVLVLAGWMGHRAAKRLRAWLSQQTAAPDGPGHEEGAVTLLVPRDRRVRIQVARAAAGGAWLLWPVVVAPVAVYVIGLAPRTVPLLALVAGTILAGRIGFATIRALFDRREPQFRVVRCPQRVARYHRGWLRFLLIVVLLTMPPVLALDLYGLFLRISLVARDWSQMLILLLLLAYTLRRRMFLPASSFEEGAAASDRLKVLLFPAIPAGVSLLLLLQLAGYPALTDYLLRGITLTALLLAAARLARELLSVWTAEHEEQVAGDERAAAAAGDVRTRPLLSTGVQLLRLLVLIGAAVLSIRAWGVSLVDIRWVLGQELWHVGGRPVTPLRLLAAMVVIAVGVFISRALRAFLKAQIYPQVRHMDVGAQAAVSTLLNYSIVGLAGYFALSIMHLDIGALTVLLGTFGLGLGLGLQPLFVNFFSGLIILFERHIKIGDIVEVAGLNGTVTSISMRSTRLRSPQNIEFVIPNGEFITGKVTNWTLTDTMLRAEIDIGVAYGTDVQLVRKLLLDIAHRDENVLVDPLPEVWFMDFASSSLQFKLACWFANPGARWKFLSQVRFEIERVFREHEIEIPFPQQKLHFSRDALVPVQVVGGPGSPGGEKLLPGEGQANGVQ